LRRISLTSFMSAAISRWRERLQCFYEGFGDAKTEGETVAFGW
jgi:hypothetical protein